MISDLSYMINTNKDNSHLTALEIRLSHEREYLSVAKTDFEKEMRTLWISQIEKEIKDEKKFLGIEDEQINMSDDELLEALGI